MYIYIHLKLVFSTGKLKSLGFFETKTPRGTHSAEILSFQREISEKSHLSWAMKKKGPWLLRWGYFLGDAILPSYMGTINNYYKDPY